MDAIYDLFAISWQEATAVVISAVVIYLVFLLLVRLFGARVISQLSTFDALVVIMLGAVAGRVILMDTPVLPAGVLGLGTLFLLEATIGQLGRFARADRLMNQRPIVLINAGEIQDAGLRKAHMSRDELASSLRLAGVRQLHEVALAVFEPNGRVSVLRAGASIDAEVLGSLDLDARPQPEK